MKKIISIGLCAIVFVSASLASLNYFEFKKSVHISQVSMPSSINSPGTTDKGDENKICPSVDAVFKKLDGLTNNLKPSLEDHVNPQWQDVLMSLSKDSSFKALESSALENNDCGAVASGFLVETYQKINLLKNAEATYERLLKFANSNNIVAIRALCFSESTLIPIEEKTRYCEMVLNIDKTSDNSLALIILQGIYQKTNKLKKLIRICKKHNNEKEKKSCYSHLPLIPDEFYYKKNYEQALEAYEEIEKYDEDGYSQSQIAEIYQNGLGTNKNLAKAIYWHKKALEKIDINNFLYIFETNNIGVAYDKIGNYVLASQYFRQAAQMGNSLAQLNLAKMYAYGQGVLRNEVEAYAWINIAIAKGLDRANEVTAKQIEVELERILQEQDFSGSLLKQAKDLAQQYYKKYVLHENPTLSTNNKSIVTKIKEAIKVLKN